MSQESGLPLSIYAIAFFFTFTFQMINPILPIYSMNKVGVDLVGVAAIVALGRLASSISKFTIGMLVRVKRSLKILLVGLVFFTICNYLYLIVQKPLHLMMVRFLHGISFGIIVILTLSLATLASEKGFRGRSISLYTGSLAFGLVAGPAVGSVIIELWGIESIFLILTFVGVVPIILAFRLFVNLELHSNHINGYGSLGILLEIFSNRTFLICSFAFFSYAIFYGTFSAYIPIYLNRNLEIPAQTVSFIFFIFFLFTSIIRSRLDTVIKKIGVERVVIFGFLNYIFFTALLFMMLEECLTITSIILMGLSHGIMLPSLAIRISRSVTYEHLILANSIYLTAFDAGFIIGPASTSILAEYYSIPLALAVSVLPALAILPFIIFKARSSKGVSQIVLHV